MNEGTQLTKLTCENCGATLIIHGQHLLKCEYCGTVYNVSESCLQEGPVPQVPQAIVNIAKEISQGR